MSIGSQIVIDYYDCKLCFTLSSMGSFNCFSVEPINRTPSELFWFNIRYRYTFPQNLLFKKFLRMSSNQGFQKNRAKIEEHETLYKPPPHLKQLCFKLQVTLYFLGTCRDIGCCEGPTTIFKIVPPSMRATLYYLRLVERNLRNTSIQKQTEVPMISQFSSTLFVVHIAVSTLWQHIQYMYISDKI